MNDDREGPSPIPGAKKDGEYRNFGALGKMLEILEKKKSTVKILYWKKK